MDLYKTENDNWQLGKELSIAFVDELAESLASEFNNKDFIPWYCGAIYDLGAERINAIRGRVQGARNKGKLFSYYVNSERKSLRNRQRLNEEKKKYNHG